MKKKLPVYKHHTQGNVVGKCYASNCQGDDLIHLGDECWSRDGHFFCRPCTLGAGRLKPVLTWNRR